MDRWARPVAGNRGFPVPANEEERLAEVRRYRILDTEPERAFDDVTRLASQICGTPIALISLMDEAREWFKAKVGTEAKEIPRELALCAHAICQEGTFIVPDAARDPRFCDNPLVVEDPKIRFYAGVPLLSPEGHALGMLCVIDRKPGKLSPAQLDALETLARFATTQLELRRSLFELEAVVRARHGHPSTHATAEALAHQRQQTSALLVHDLKNPLGTMLLIGRALTHEPNLSPEGREAVSDLLGASESMLRMVMDMLDVARSEGSGLARRSTLLDLAALVDFAVKGIARDAAANHVELVMEVESNVGIEADPELLRRTLQNLLENAIRYSGEGRSVEVRGYARGDTVVVEIKDQGIGIKEEDRARIFEPHVQVDAGARRGHGLGLVFCRRAVEAHGGRIRVEANEPRGTKFVVELPRTRISR